MKNRNVSKEDKQFVYSKGGYLPKKFEKFDRKVDMLIQNRPIFDPKNKKEVLKWVRDMVFALKGKDV